jgi:hypothetical protein
MRTETDARRSGFARGHALPKVLLAAAALPRPPVRGSFAG